MDDHAFKDPPSLEFIYFNGCARYHVIKNYMHRDVLTGDIAVQFYRVLS